MGKKLPSSHFQNYAPVLFDLSGAPSSELLILSTHKHVHTYSTICKLVDEWRCRFGMHFQHACEETSVIMTGIRSIFLGWRWPWRICCCCFMSLVFWEIENLVKQQLNRRVWSLILCSPSSFISLIISFLFSLINFPYNWKKKEYTKLLEYVLLVHRKLKQFKFIEDHFLLRRRDYACLINQAKYIGVANWKEIMKVRNITFLFHQKPVKGPIHHLLHEYSTSPLIRTIFWCR